MINYLHFVWWIGSNLVGILAILLIIVSYQHYFLYIQYSRYFQEKANNLNTRKDIIYSINYKIHSLILRYTSFTDKNEEDIIELKKKMNSKKVLMNKILLFIMVLVILLFVIYQSF
jgi:hypothetical protein